MKKYLLVLLVVLISFSVLSGQSYQVAVFDFKDNGIGKGATGTISDFFITELINLKKWKVIERDKINKILKEIELQNTGLTQMERAIEVGKILNVEKIILGSAGKLGSLYILQARVVDVETGNTESAKKVTCKCPIDEIIPSIENLAKQVLGITTEETFVKGKQIVSGKDADLSKMIIIESGIIKLGLSDFGLKILSKLNKYISASNYSSCMPQVEVFVDSFYIDKNEVTNREFKEFCDHTERPYPGNPGWGGKYSNYFLNFPEHPVVNVSWYDAMDYAKWSGKRLPTEAEWEIASKNANNDKLWVWGMKWIPNAANVNNSSRQFTSSVGEFTDDQTVAGISDLIGNVSEWCLDNFSTSYYLDIPYNNPKGSENGRGKSVRGGNWSSEIIFSVIPFRMSLPPDNKSNKIGFRCVYENKTN